MIDEKIQKLFSNYPQVLYGFCDISYSEYADQYASALIFAVPYPEQLTLKTYREEAFQNTVQAARREVEEILGKLEPLLQEEKTAYYIPPTAQNNEEELLAPFSFKYAAVRAGLGWIGKNDVVITEAYGPRLRLSAVLIDAPFAYGVPVTQSKCPGSCRKCVDACPSKALRDVRWDPGISRSEIIDYHLCNQKRSRYIEKHGRKNACGVCMACCPIGGEKILS